MTRAGSGCASDTSTRGSGILERSSTCGSGRRALTVAAPPEPAGTVNRSRWLPIAGLGLAPLMVTLDIFEYLEVVHKRQRRHSSLGMLTPIEFENAFTVA